MYIHIYTCNYNYMYLSSAQGVVGKVVGSSGAGGLGSQNALQTHVVDYDIVSYAIPGSPIWLN